MLPLLCVCATVLAVGQCKAELSPQEMWSPVDTVMDPIFDGINVTDVDKQAAKRVWEGAYKVIVDSSTDVAKTDDRYVKWFGPKDEGRVITVEGAFLDMKKSMETVQYTLYFNAQECERDEYAETSYGSNYIYLCKGYIHAQEIFDFNSQLGTMVYSLAIAASNMEYIARIDTPEECQNLAVDAPLKAVRSAYNYEYYCEDRPPTN